MDAVADRRCARDGDFGSRARSPLAGAGTPAPFGRAGRAARLRIPVLPQRAAGGLGGDRGRARERRLGPLGTRAGIPGLAAGGGSARLHRRRDAGPRRRGAPRLPRASALDGRVRPAVPGPRVHARQAHGPGPSRIGAEARSSLPLVHRSGTVWSDAVRVLARVRAPPHAVRLDRLPLAPQSAAGRSDAAAGLAYRRTSLAGHERGGLGGALDRGLAGLLGQRDLVLLADRAPRRLALLRRPGDRRPALSRGG